MSCSAILDDIKEKHFCCNGLLYFLGKNLFVDLIVDLYNYVTGFAKIMLKTFMSL